MPKPALPYGRENTLDHGAIDMTRAMVAIVLTALCAGLGAQSFKCKVAVAAGEYDRAGAVVSVDIDLPPKLASKSLVATAAPVGRRTDKTPAQVVALDGTTTAYWTVAELAAGEEQAYRLSIRAGEQTEPGFSYQDTEGQYLDCLFDGRPVTRLMYYTYSPEDHEETKKVFHGVFAPDGETLITKGTGRKFPRTTAGSSWGGTGHRSGQR